MLAGASGDGAVNFARAADELAGNQERQEVTAEGFDHRLACDQVVFVASIGVTEGIYVVFQQVDAAACGCSGVFGSQGCFGVLGEVVQNAVACFVHGE